MSLRPSSRSAALLVVTVAAALSLSACVFNAEPAPGSPSNPHQLSDEGFPPPGPAPVPGQITPAPQPGPVVPSSAPRPDRGPVPTPGPATSATTPRPTGNPAPPPGS